MISEEKSYRIRPWRFLDYLNERGENGLDFTFSLKYHVDMNERQMAARILGRLGGLKGGKARAAKLTPERRKEIAEKAIAARWAKKRTAE